MIFFACLAKMGLDAPSYAYLFVRLIFDGTKTPPSNASQLLHIRQFYERPR